MGSVSADRAIRYAALAIQAAELERAGRSASGEEAAELLRDALATRARMLELCVET